MSPVGVLPRPVDVELVRPGVLVAETWPAPVRREHLRADLTPREFATDFVRRLGISEAIKREIRARYRDATRRPPRDYDAARARAGEFWSEYEAVNRLWTPEDPVYSQAKEGVAASTTNSTFEIGAASAGQTRILEVFIGGEATAAAVLRMIVRRVSSQGTGTTPTAYTPEKFNTRSPAAAGTYYGAINANVAWGTAQETLASASLINFAMQAFGGTDRWVASPGEEIYLVNAEFASLRSSSGTSTISALLVVEEL